MAISFKTWVRMFENYLLVISATGNTWTEARERALLLHCLGSEGQRIFHTLPDSGNDLATAITALQNHFTPDINVVAVHHAFRKRVQGAQETIVQYIAALRQLTATCKFPNGGYMIRDQLVEHVANPRIRERLLLKEKLTLTEAITIVTQIELATQQAKAMAGDQHLPVQVVQTKSAERRQRPQRHGHHYEVAPRVHCMTSFKTYLSFLCTYLLPLWFRQTPCQFL